MQDGDDVTFRRALKILISLYGAIVRKAPRRIRDEGLRFHLGNDSLCENLIEDQAKEK